jgi:hypothetical protein
MVTKTMVMRIQQRNLNGQIKSMSLGMDALEKILIAICLINNGCEASSPLTCLLVGLLNLIPCHLSITIALSFNLLPSSIVFQAQWLIVESNVSYVQEFTTNILALILCMG